MLPGGSLARGNRKGRNARSTRISDDESRTRQNLLRTKPSRRDDSNPRLGTGPRPQRTEATRGRGTFPKALIKSNATPRNNAQSLQAPRNSSAHGSGSFQQRYQTLKKARERERADAIANGFLADPDRPRTLAEAITPVGTCQDMCPEFERVERVVQNDIWTAEVDPDHQSDATWKQLPDESRMIKKFRRAAAGVDEQLPSDLRPPQVLQLTVNHLFNTVIGEVDSLSNVHYFVWDRTRAIRNDFSIQQLTKVPDLRIAIDCYERIARFHIVSLHLLALTDKPYEKYDAQQEREQLDKTLLSLMQYYDDSRGRMQLPHEAEFRSYCIIFQIQDPTPNLEDRIQCWPREIIGNARVQRALKLYAAACNASEPQGPLRPRTHHPIAQANWRRFWRLINSNEVSYLMACVAEIYFPYIRRMTINAIWTSYRQSNKQTSEWPLDELTGVLGLETEDEVQEFCEKFGFRVTEREDGVSYLDLTSVTGRSLPDPLLPQRKSRVVEAKRRGRSLPAVIDGISVRNARKTGMVQEVLEVNEEKQDEESLFVPEVSNDPASSGFSRAGRGRLKAPISPKDDVPVSNPLTPNFTPHGQGALSASNPSKASSPPKDFTWRPDQQIRFGKSEASSTNDSKFRIPEQPPLSQSEVNLKPNSVFSLAKSSPFSQTRPIDQSFTSSISNFKGREVAAGGQTLNSEVDGTSGNQSALSSFSQPVNDQSVTKKNPFTFSQGVTASSIKSDSRNSNSIFTFGEAPKPITESPDINRSQNSADSGFSQVGSDPSPDSLPNQSSKPNSQPNLPSFGEPEHKPFQFGSSNNLKPQSTLNPSFNTAPYDPSPNPRVTASSVGPTYSAPTPVVNSLLKAETNESFQPLFHTSQAKPSKPSANLTFGNSASRSPLFQSQSTTTPDTNSSLASKAPQSSASASSPSHLKTMQTSTQARRSSGPSLQQRAIHQAAEKASKERELALKNQKQKDRHNKTIECLAKRLMFEPRGYLDQYVEHTIGQLVERTQLREEADRFRTSRIMLRYGTLWREICWARRVSRQGRERRMRRARDAEIRAQRARETNISAQIEAFRETQPNASSLSPVVNMAPPQQASTVKSLVSLVDRTEPLPSATMQSSMPPPITRPVRPTSSHSLSTSGGRSSIRNHGAGQQSSLRNRPPLPSGSVARPVRSPTGRPSYGSQSYDTTRSTYFRLKAMGLNPNDKRVFSPNPRKSSSVASASSSNSLKLRENGINHMSPLGNRKRYRGQSAGSPINFDDTAASSSAKRQHMTPQTPIGPALPQSGKPTSPEQDEDEAIFAAVRQARQAMSDSISFFHEEIAKEESRPQSQASQSPLEHPNISMHPSEISNEKLGGSVASFGSSRTGRKKEPPPKYRSRVSKFLPREMYADKLMQRNKHTVAQAKERPRPAVDESRQNDHVDALEKVEEEHPQSSDRPFGSSSTTANYYTPFALPSTSSFGQLGTVGSNIFGASPGPSPFSQLSGDHFGFASNREAETTDVKVEPDPRTQPQPRHRAVNEANANPFALLNGDNGENERGDTQDSDENSEQLQKESMRKWNKTQSDLLADDREQDSEESGYTFEYDEDDEGSEVESEDEEVDGEADTMFHKAASTEQMPAIRRGGAASEQQQVERSKEKFGKGGTSVEDAIEL